MATLAQAISSTSSTAPESNRSAGRTAPTVSSVIAMTATPRPDMGAGYASVSARATASMSAWAVASVADGARRAMTSYEWESRSVDRPSPNPNGIQIRDRPG